MVDWKKLAKDVGSKAKDVSVSVGKQAGIGLSDSEKEERERQKLKSLQMKAEFEEAKLKRQAVKNEYRARIATAKKTFNENRPPSGFDRFKKTLDGMKAQAQEQQAKAKVKQPLKKVKPKQQGMNFEDMLGMSGSSQGSFEDMIGGLSSISKKKKTKKKSKKKRQQSWEDMIGGGMF